MQQINNMKLNDILNGQFDATEWEAKGYQLPKFDIKALREKTAKEPTWVHFGGGNIFRAFPAAILNDALNTGKYDRGATRPMPHTTTSHCSCRFRAQVPSRRKSSPV